MATTISRHLDDGRIEIDNNFVERAMRRIAHCRNSWPFRGSVRGALRAVAIVLTRTN